MRMSELYDSAFKQIDVERNLYLARSDFWFFVDVNAEMFDPVYSNFGAKIRMIKK